ncbi:diguanylate cyclase [Planobispora siamensis]|uniref:GGDEF domain-containing protein n=1 Tax=Planobispora siamensis TaxID=936338 RepID=A0A8J3SET2_9ACTN|nr:diguanylate cyclase [Planobispora siamensis]GIH92903.1 GGDEF domain-containing protein [Planobispora siamensis]
MRETVLALLFVLSALVAAWVAGVAWRRRSTTTATGILAVLASAIALWCLSGGLMAVSGDTGAPLVLWVLLFVGICVVPPGFLLLSWALTDRGWRPSRRTVLLLTVEPVITVGAVATDPWLHGFLAPGAAPLDPAGITPISLAHVAYSYLLLAAAAARIMYSWVRGPHHQRMLYGLTLLAALPPTIGNVLNVTGVVRDVDLSPLGFCVTLTVTYWLFVRRSLYELVPVARQDVFEMINDMVVTLDGSARILDLNPAADRLVRRLMPDLPARLTGLPMNEVLCDVDLSEGTHTDRIYADYKGSGVDLNVRVSTLGDGRGGHVGWAVVARDITALNRQRVELEAANARLRDQLHTIEALRADLAEQAVRDTLTGLYNRRHLVECMLRETERAGREGSPLSLALLDIDHFKQINDRYGHLAGDQVLVRLAELLAAEFRRDEVVTRHGGEEFVILFPGVSGEQALARTEALRGRVEAESVRAGEHVLSITLSAGVSSYVSGMSCDDLLSAADRALYAAKRAGRNRVEPARGPGPSGVAA